MGGEGGDEGDSGLESGHGSSSLRGRRYGGAIGGHGDCGGESVRVSCEGFGLGRLSEHWSFVKKHFSLGFGFFEFLRVLGV